MRFYLAISILGLAACVDEPTTFVDEALARRTTPVLTPQSSGTTVRLQSIAPISERVAWISGASGTVLRTTDAGATWELHVVPGAETLAFRDIHAVDDRTAWVLTNNGGPDARIYKTIDAGATWTLEFTSPIANTFYDCFAFWTPRRAIAIPDAENGRFDVVRMEDGQTWDNIGDLFPAGQPGEGLFPTSGNCVTTFGRHRAWAVLAGASPSRVVATGDDGDTWASFPIPIPGGPTSGGMNVRFRDPHHGIVSGGDVTRPADLQINFARSHDGGQTWDVAASAPFPGAAYGLSYALDEDDEDDDCGTAVFAAGPGGAAWSRDEGDNWELLAGAATGYFSVEMASRHRGWLVGNGGAITRIDL
jgi:photosystem II stability/assembly factor-like uncharacterized protein